MRTVRKVLGLILRPIYKGFFERPLWWFLAREIGPQLGSLGPHLESIEHRLAAIEERLDSTDANNTAQWRALEQLLLALYRQPEVQVGSNVRFGGPPDELTSSAAGQNRTNERNNLR
jgi:hypothetical protein